MDRLELIREIVDKEFNKIQKPEMRRLAFVHTYGVSQMSALLATARQANVELACVAAMLHDVALYTLNCSHATHAQKSSEYARKLLTKTKEFSDDEINIICNVIASHSDKLTRHSGVLSEILKDADVLQHHLYNTNIPLSDKDRVRLYYLLETFQEMHQAKEAYEAYRNKKE